MKTLQRKFAKLNELSFVDSLAIRLGIMDVYRITSESTISDVQAAYKRGDVIEAEDRESAYAQGQAVEYVDVSELVCPHCDEWIGHPDYDEIAHVSDDHDVTHCE